MKERLAVASLSSKLTQPPGLPPVRSITMEPMYALNALRSEKLILLDVCANEKLRNELLAKAFGLLTNVDDPEAVFVYEVHRLQQEDMLMLGVFEL
jgi:hypothetical protein